MTFASTFAPTSRAIAAAALALPALSEAHGLGGVPHSHDAVAWGSFVAATAVGYAAYLAVQRALQRRRQRIVRRPNVLPNRR